MHFRIAALLLLFGLAACTGNPRALGITGPGLPQPAEAAEPVAPETVPEPTYGGGRYAPGMVPDAGSGRYWGYN
jgi:hypothetical protein